MDDVQLLMVQRSREVTATLMYPYGSMRPNIPDNIRLTVESSLENLHLKLVTDVEGLVYSSELHVTRFNNGIATPLVLRLDGGLSMLMVRELRSRLSTASHILTLFRLLSASLQSPEFFLSEVIIPQEQPRVAVQVMKLTNLKKSLLWLMQRLIRLDDSATREAVALARAEQHIPEGPQPAQPRVQQRRLQLMDQMRKRLLRR